MRQVVLGICTVGVALMFLVIASRSRAQGADDVSPLADEAALQAAYEAHLAANTAAAEAYAASHPAPAADALSDTELLVAENYGCPEGTQFWQRDRITDFCAVLCASDAECGPEDGRCRILDVATREHAPEVLLVDDMPADEIDDAMEGTVEETPPVMVCDPFYDVEGAVDADLVDVAVE